MTSKNFPEPTVGALVFSSNNDVLLVQPAILNGLWAIPGGHVECGETITRAVIREVKEETGLDIFDVRFIAFQECIFDAAFSEKKHYLFFDFFCRTNSSDVVLNGEHTGFQWVTVTEALDLPLHEYSKQLLCEYQKGSDSVFSRLLLFDYYRNSPDSPRIK